MVLILIYQRNDAPTDVTVGTNARLIGAFEYDSTNGVQQTINYFDWGLAGWDFCLQVMEQVQLLNLI